MTDAGRRTLAGSACRRHRREPRHRRRHRRGHWPPTGVRVSLLGSRCGHTRSAVAQELGGRSARWPMSADVTDAASVRAGVRRPRAAASVRSTCSSTTPVRRRAPNSPTPTTALWNRIVGGQPHRHLPVLRARPFRDMLQAGFGRIVNIASIAGLRGAAYISAYVSLEARRHRPDARARAGVRDPQHHGECRVPGLRRYRHREERGRQHHAARPAAARPRRSPHWLPPIRSAG